ncbi:MAG: respiratory nitrate reductase subunit gamma [Bacillota bacterium]|nr:respiratory nitrate reductase subunit gamma [Bacillota bacterium]
MTGWEIFWWVVFPYISLTIFVGGHIYRYATDRYGWSSHSSQILERRILSWASPLFHYGIILVLLGHVPGILLPISWSEALGISDSLYHLAAVGLGGVAGLMMTVGLVGLVWRRWTVERVKNISLFSDHLVLMVLLIVSLLGLGATFGYNLFVEPYNYRATVGPWFRSLFTFHPDPAFMVSAPLIYQLHVASTFFLYIVWPFSRLVHVWSFPIAYLRRATILYRAHGGWGKVPSATTLSEGERKPS